MLRTVRQMDRRTDRCNEKNNMFPNPDGEGGWGRGDIIILIREESLGNKDGRAVSTNDAISLFLINV